MGLFSKSTKITLRLDRSKDTINGLHSILDAINTDSMKFAHMKDNKAVQKIRYALSAFVKDTDPTSSDGVHTFVSEPVEMSEERRKFLEQFVAMQKRVYGKLD